MTLRKISYEEYCKLPNCECEEFFDPLQTTTNDVIYVTEGDYSLSTVITTALCHIHMQKPEEVLVFCAEKNKKYDFCFAPYIINVGNTLFDLMSKDKKSDRNGVQYGAAGFAWDDIGRSYIERACRDLTFVNWKDIFNQIDEKLIQLVDAQELDNQKINSSDPLVSQLIDYVSNVTSFDEFSNAVDEFSFSFTDFLIEVITELALESFTEEINIGHFLVWKQEGYPLYM